MAEALGRAGALPASAMAPRMVDRVVGALEPAVVQAVVLALYSRRSSRRTRDHGGVSLFYWDLGQYRDRAVR